MESISIIREVTDRYPFWVDPKYSDIRLTQTSGRVWLETTEDLLCAHGIDQETQRLDLAFIRGKGEEPLFSVGSSALQNAWDFIHAFSADSIARTTRLFHAEAMDAFADADARRAGSAQCNRP